MQSAPEMGADGATHLVRNLRTGIVTRFSFVRTEVPHLWNLVTPEGVSLGTWNKRSRAYALDSGLSNHVIVKIEEECNREIIRSWRYIRQGDT